MNLKGAAEAHSSKAYLNNRSAVLIADSPTGVKFVGVGVIAEAAFVV
ncbi:MAG: hypothetical protein Q8N60_01885 [Candidatus Diapherotrites archaeon]|nr:hypothetical protein [Candidatus Diapherotrites archaeon]